MQNITFEALNSTDLLVGLKENMKLLSLKGCIAKKYMI